jgi:hypothetical protein
MTTFDTVTLPSVPKNTDSPREVDVPADVLWGARNNARSTTSVSGMVSSRAR